MVRVLIISSLNWLLLLTDFDFLVFENPVLLIFQVNNAGVNFNIGSSNSVESAEIVVATNYFGTKNMIKAMVPLMRPSPAGARIVNVSSRLGRLGGRRNVSAKIFCLLEKNFLVRQIARQD